MLVIRSMHFECKFGTKELQVMGGIDYCGALESHACVRVD